MRLCDVKLGIKVGNLTITDEPFKRFDSKDFFVECRCNCGNLTIVSIYNLGRTTNSCGCLIGSKSVNIERITDKLGRFTRVTRDLTGQKFNKLTAVKRLRFRTDGEKYERWYWECLCDCGETVDIREYDLCSGKIKSCGCLIVKGNAKPYGESSSRTHYRRYKTAAEKRDISFNLSKEQFQTLTSQNCYYCGIEPIELKFTKCSNGGCIVNGIDRVDNLVGYCVENCVACCSDCNMAKRDLSVDAFLDLVKRIYSHNNLGLK